MAPTILTLPQELQDQIFEFAYGVSPGVKYISSCVWEERETEKRLDDASGQYRARPCPFKVNEFMVCKAWLRNAAAAYAGHPNGLPYFSHDIQIPQQGIGWAFFRSTGLMDFNRIGRMLPNLRSLTLHIKSITFARVSPRHVALDEFGEADFLKILGQINIRGLQAFNVVVDHDFQRGSATNEAQVALLKRNVRAMEDFVRGQVMQPRTEGLRMSTVGAQDIWKSLYPGSAVSSNSTQIRTRYVGSAQGPEHGGTHFLYKYKPIVAARKDSDFCTTEVPIVSKIGLSSSVSTVTAGAKVSGAKVDVLKDEDIPDNRQALVELMNNRGAALTKWVQEAKKRNAKVVAKSKVRKAKQTTVLPPYLSDLMTAIARDIRGLLGFLTIENLSHELLSESDIASKVSISAVGLIWVTVVCYTILSLAYTSRVTNAAGAMQKGIGSAREDNDLGYGVADYLLASGMSLRKPLAKHCYAGCLYAECKSFVQMLEHGTNWRLLIAERYYREEPWR